MNTKRLLPLLIVLIVASMALVACNDEAASPTDINWWPWNWGNKTLVETMTKKCTGLPAGSSVQVNGNLVPCSANTGSTTGSDTSSTAPATTGLTATKNAEFNSVSTTVTGPAIAQLWDGKSKSGCNIVKVPKGKSLTWSGQGHWWMYEGADEAAFNAEWETSQQAYKNSSPQCTGNFTSNVK